MGVFGWKKTESTHDFSQLFKADPQEFLDSFATMDETRVHYYIPKSEQQSKQ